MNTQQPHPSPIAALRRGAVAPAICCLLATGSAQATDFVWIAGAANWNTPGAWNPPGPPSPSGDISDHAFINNGGTATISADIADIKDIKVASGLGTSGTLNQTGGSLFQGTGGWVFIGQEGGVGTYNLSGGTHDKQWLLLGQAGTGTLNLSGTGVIDNDAVFVGVIGGSGQVNMTGGTLRTGTVTLENGNFDMSGGVLTATTFNGDLAQDGGTTSPGDTLGIMTVDGNYALNAGDLLIELAGLTAGVEYDQLAVTGSVSLAGSLSLSLLPGFVPSIGDIFEIIDNQGLNPIVGSFAQGASISVGGFDFDIDYMGGDGNDVTLTVAALSSAVSEPGVVYLLSTGLVFAGAAGRRRRSERRG